MRPSRVVLLVVAALLVFGRAAYCETPPDLQKAIADGVQMLEHNEYGPFLKRFVPEKDRADLQIDDPEFVKGFGANKAPILLKAMKFAQKLTPTMSEDGKVASYDLKDMEGAPERPLVFRKYDDGQWCIDN